jgi:L-rhamnose mutarotase
MKNTMSKNLLEEIGESLQEKKVISTHKMTDQQKKLFKAYKALADSAEKMATTAETAKKKFWNKVEADLDNFDDEMRIDVKNLTIEVLGE